MNTQVGKNKKNTNILLSAELAKRMVKVKQASSLFHKREFSSFKYILHVI